jgi:hypothetical protein
VAFSLLIELTNIRVKKKRKGDKSNPVKLKKGYTDQELSEAVEDKNQK